MDVDNSKRVFFKRKIKFIEESGDFAGNWDTSDDVEKARNNSNMLWEIITKNYRDIPVPVHRAVIPCCKSHNLQGSLAFMLLVGLL